MSYSDFKEQKVSTFEPDVSPTFPLKRRTTYQNRWQCQSLSVKKLFKNIHSFKSAALRQAFSFERAAIVGIQMNPATRKFNFF